MQPHVRSVFGLLFRFFARESGGSLLPMFALTMVPVMGMVGAAVDYSRASGVQTGLQTALDAAVLAGARDGTANWANVALAIFNASLPDRGASVAAPTFTKNPDGSFSGSATANVSASFLKVMGTSSIATVAQSKAVLSGSTAQQFCVVALSSNAQPAVRLTGNASIDINAPQCIFQVNSNSAGAVTLNGNTSISSAGNCFVGTATKIGNATLSPSPDFMCKPVPDPFADYAKPSVGPCDHVNYSASGNQTITLQPGVYCGGMQFSGQVTVTFAPGLFVIKDGVLQASGGTSFTGNGVSFFLTGAGAGVRDRRREAKDQMSQAIATRALLRREMQQHVQQRLEQFAALMGEEVASATATLRTEVTELRAQIAKQQQQLDEVAPPPMLRLAGGR